MKLTPLDIHHKEFRSALRGYNEKEVDAFLDEVADEYERLFKENVDLNERLQATLDRIKSYEDMKETLQNTLLVAQKHAEDVETDASKRAELMIREADLRAQQIVGDALADKQRIQQEVLRIRKAEEQYRAAMSELLDRQIKQVEAVEVPSGFPTDEDVAATAERADEVATRPPSAVPVIAPGRGTPAALAMEAVEEAPPEPPAFVPPEPAAAAAPPAAAPVAATPSPEVAPTLGSGPVWGVPEPQAAPPAPTAPVSAPTPPATSSAPAPGASLGSSSLTLGEVAPPADLGMDEVPRFTDPAEFNVPRAGATMGEAEADSEIEEID